MSKTKKITIWALSFVMVIALGLGGFFLTIKTKPFSVFGISSDKFYIAEFL